MNINIKLNTQSIKRAIDKLQKILEPLDDDCYGVLDALAEEAADEAQRAYGDWAVQVVPFPPQSGSTEVVVYGDMPAIAEFGAGDATLTPSEFFESTGLDADVWPGSYSLYKGSMSYYFFKHWRFAGKWYEEIPPRLGMYQAKMHLLNNSTEIVQGVMDID